RVFRALARTADLQSSLGQTAAATATRRKILARFAAIADSDKTRPGVAPIAAQAALDLLQPQLQAFLATKPEPGQLPKRQADLAALVTAARAADAYGVPAVQAATAVVRSRLRRHLALQLPAATPDLAASLQADAIADLADQLRSHPRHAELRRELRYYQPDLAPPPGVGVLAEYDLPGTLPVAIELPAPASDTAVVGAYNQALAHYRDGHLDQAIAAARTAVKLDANHSRSKVLLSTLQLRSGDPAGALATLDAGLVARPTDVMLMAQKIQVLGAAGKLDEAVKLADAALRLDHTNPEVMWSLGQAYRRAGRDGLARLAYERAMAVYLEDLPRSDDDNRRSVRQYDDRKLRSFGTLQGVDAEALPHDAGLAQIHAAYAQLAMHATPAEVDIARAKFEKALTYRPNCADFYANLGAALLTAGDPAALEPLQKAMELRHNDPRLLNNLALAQRLLSQPDLARATLLQARRLDPKLPEPLYNLALLRLDTLRDAAGLAEIRELLTQFKQLRGPLPADQPDPADALLAEAEALLAWRLAVTH
ncbi:MAG: tetratricopeptide repeat protein, partial [Deltaproteobacteria bacterium]|nr:tetratricopeptide repeat protein [Deltaproteobacteria bacterium]